MGVPKTYEEYRRYAGAVYHSVINLMTVGRGNTNRFAQLLTGAEAAKCVSKMRADYADEVAGLAGQTVRILEVIARYAAKRGCGNCEEFAALTFTLLRKQGIYPLDRMHQDGIGGTTWGNHAFVIVGLDGHCDAKDISTWNREVVWCDPYEEKIGGLEEIKDRFGGETIWSKCRWDWGQARVMNE